jgi:hypothetical protein
VTAIVTCAVREALPSLTRSESSCHGNPVSGESLQAATSGAGGEPAPDQLAVGG